VLTSAIGGYFSSLQAADSSIRPNVRYGTARALVGLFSWFRDGGTNPDRGAERVTGLPHTLVAVSVRPVLCY